MKALWVWAVWVWAAATGRPAAAASCQPIAVELCRATGYNYTSSPNLVGHESQADADFTLQTFSPLVQYGCSAQLAFFLCSVYVPMCNEKVAVPIGPCRGLCESVRARCYPVLQGFGFPWPAALDCAKFPALNDHQHMCMEGPGEVAMAHPIASSSSSPCSQYARPSLYHHHPAGTDTGTGCLQLCNADVLFTQRDKELAQAWIAVLSTICVIGTLLALMTFLGDPARLLYPQRPLAFLAICYNLMAVGWGLRATLGREAIACYPAPTPAHTPPDLLLAQAGLGHAHCSLVFFLTYYFGNAVSVWWLVLMACKVLCQGLGWSHERVLPHAPILHLLSWGLPACLTIAVLVLRYVDADELTGMCSVGNHSPEALLTLVIVPQGLCLIVGVFMATVGSLQGLWQGRSLALPLYLLQSIAVVAAYCYQLWGYHLWILRLPPSPTPRQQPHALPWLFLLRSLLCLITGTFVSIWIICQPKSVFCSVTSDYKKPKTLAARPMTKCQKSLYFYNQPAVHRIHKNHRKHKCKNGDETLV